MMPAWLSSLPKITVLQILVTAEDASYCSGIDRRLEFLKTRFFRKYNRLLNEKIR